MRFIFTKIFYAAVALGFVPLSLSWRYPWLKWVVFAYDLGLVIVAVIDSRTSHLRSGVVVTREFGGRFAVGAETEVRIHVQNGTSRSIQVIIKDEYPPEMVLNGVREGFINVGAQASATLIYGLTPPRRGRFEFGYTAL